MGIPSHVGLVHWEPDAALLPPLPISSTMGGGRLWAELCRAGKAMWEQP